MTSSYKFGVFLGVLLFAKAVIPHFLIGVKLDMATFDLIANIVIPALLIYSGIRAFIASPTPRPAYKYSRGVVIGLGISAIGAVLFVLLFGFWSYFTLSRPLDLSSLMFDFMHIFPTGVILSLIIPILFFNKKDDWSEAQEGHNILDKNL